MTAIPQSNNGAKDGPENPRWYPMTSVNWNEAANCSLEAEDEVVATYKTAEVEANVDDIDTNMDDSWEENLE